MDLDDDGSISNNLEEHLYATNDVESDGGSVLQNFHIFEEDWDDLVTDVDSDPPNDHVLEEDSDSVIEGEEEDDDDESDTDDDAHDENNISEWSYKKILKKLSDEWIICESDHRISKQASNCFFDLGKKWFYELFDAKRREGIFKETPKFVSIRRKLNKKLPDISLDFRYKHKVTGEIVELKDLESTPTGKYPPNEYDKLCEIASVKVISSLNCYENCVWSKIRSKFLLSAVKKTNEVRWA